MRKAVSVEMPVTLDVTMLCDGRYLACADPGSPYIPWSLVVRSLEANTTLKEWPTPPGRDYGHTGASANGRYAGVTAERDVSQPAPPGVDLSGLRVGLLDAGTLEIVWVDGLAADSTGTTRQMAASNDGTYVAIAGWNHRLAIVDVPQRKVLYAGGPDGAFSTGCVAFSSNGLTTYAGDSRGDGGVYALETRTGKISNRWYTTDTGGPGRGRPVQCLATSPDDTMLAAGTGPEGQVYLMKPDSAAKPVVLRHGGGTTLMVSFSPDSKRLATVAGGKIKIWDVAPMRSRGYADSAASVASSAPSELPKR